MQGPDPVPPIWQEILRQWLVNPTWSFDMNIQDIFYHGIREQIRRIVTQMTDLEIERGLDAFDTGTSSWSHCFFARALPQLELDEGRPEQKLMEHFGLKNRIPLRIIWCTFDGAGKVVSREQLCQFIKEINLGESSPELDKMLRQIDFKSAENHTPEVCSVEGLKGLPPGSYKVSGEAAQRLMEQDLKQLEERGNYGVQID